MLSLIPMKNLNSTITKIAQLPKQTTNIWVNLHNLKSLAQRFLNTSHSTKIWNSYPTLRIDKIKTTQGTFHQFFFQICTEIRRELELWEDEEEGDLFGTAGHHGVVVGVVQSAVLRGSPADGRADRHRAVVRLGDGGRHLQPKFVLLILREGDVVFGRSRVFGCL